MGQERESASSFRNKALAMRVEMAERELEEKGIPVRDVETARLKLAIVDVLVVYQERLKIEAEDAIFLLHLLAQSDANFVVHVRQSDIAKSLGKSERTIQRYVTKLADPKREPMPLLRIVSSRPQGYDLWALVEAILAAENIGRPRR